MKVPVSQIQQHLADNPSVCVINSICGKIFIVQPNYYCDGHPFESCKNEIQPYLQKYDINNYTGHISCKIIDNKTFLFYKNQLIFNRPNLHYQDIFSSVIYTLKELLKHEEEINTASFNLKEKDILYHLLEFQRYLCLNIQKTKGWLSK